MLLMGEHWFVSPLILLWRKAVCRSFRAFWPACGPNCFLSWGWAFDGLFNKLKKSVFIPRGGLWENLQSWRDRRLEMGMVRIWRWWSSQEHNQIFLSTVFPPMIFPKPSYDPVVHSEWPWGRRCTSEGHRMLAARFIALMEVRFAIISVSCKVEMLSLSL